MLRTLKQPSKRLSKMAIGLKINHNRSTRKVLLTQNCKMISSSFTANEMSTNSTSQTSTVLPSEADVVVVGGGIMGCFMLYHLAKLGVKSAVLLERDRLTCGTTWHTNGLVWRLRPGDVDVAILNATRDQILALEEEEPAGWITNGGLFIASNKVRMQEYSRLYTLGRVMGIECELLSPDEVSELYPLMNISDVEGALYSPGDGTIDPATLCATLIRQAKARGAQVFEGVGVTGVETDDTLSGRKSIQTVHTSAGPIRTKALVNCAGVWSCGSWGSNVGQKLPLVAVKHSIVVMEDIPGVRVLPNVRDHDGNMCLRVQGDCLIVGGYEKGPELWEKVEPDFSFGLFDFDFDGFSEILEGAVHRVPALAESGIKTTLCGPEAFTPDRKPLLGEDGDVSGLFHGSGFNSSGCMYSGGCAEQLAHWIVNGRPSLDMYAYDCRRFSDHVRGKPVWAWARSHEAYTTNYSIVFPRNQPLAGRSAIVDDLYEPLTALGCFMEESTGWERPGFFLTDGTLAPLLEYDWQAMYDHEPHTSYAYKDILGQGLSFEIPQYNHLIESEYNALKQSAVIVNLSSSGKVLLGGPDVDAAVNFLFMNKISKDDGAVTPSLLLNQRGGVDAAVTVFSLHDEQSIPSMHGWQYLVTAASGSGPMIWRKLRDLCHVHGFHVNVKSYTHNLAIMAIKGPNSEAIIKAAGFSRPESEMGKTLCTTIGEHEVLLWHCGQNHWEVHVDANKALPVYNQIFECGKYLGLLNAGYKALDVHSLERGECAWHYDLRSDDTPIEAGLWPKDEPDCQNSSQKQNFLGYEQLLCQKNHGVTKTRVMLQLNSQGNLSGLEGIVRDGQLVGSLRRAGHSYVTNSGLGIGYIKHSQQPPLTWIQLEESTWEIEIMGNRVPASLYNPQNHI